MGFNTNAIFGFLIIANIFQRMFKSISGSIDTPNYLAYISPERMDAFQLTNHYFTSRFVAIYAQKQDVTINFSGNTAGISLEAFLVMIMSWEKSDWCERFFLQKLQRLLRRVLKNTRSS